MNHRVAHPFPFAPLREAAGIATLAGLARCISVDDAQLHRWRRDGLTVMHADRAAVALGLHPSEIWPTWWTVPIDERQLRAVRPDPVRVQRARTRWFLAPAIDEAPGECAPAIPHADLTDRVWLDNWEAEVFGVAVCSDNQFPAQVISGEPMK